MRLVLFVAVQKIVFIGTFPNRLLNRKPHHQEAHAVPRERRIESGLIEVKRRTIEKSVERGRRRAIHAQHVQSQPSALEREPAPFPVKLNQIARMECVRPAALASSRVVQRHHDLDGFTAFLSRSGPLEPNGMLLIQSSPFAAEVIAMLGSQARKIRIPGVTGKRDEGTNSRLCLPDAPPSTLQSVGNVPGARIPASDLSPLDRAIQPRQVLG